MLRYWFLTHRYLGIICGLIMLLWTLSGIVMMYKPYPRLNHWQSLQLQPDLQLDHCCQLPDSQSLNNHSALTNLQMDMHTGDPVLRFTTADGQWHGVNLASGVWLDTLTASRARLVVEHFMQQNLPDADPQPLAMELIERDQWTVYSAYHPHRPLYRAALQDAEGTEVYVSSRTGQVVQVTTRDSRLWGYLGAVVHWIYPTALRQYTASWYYLIIILSLLGCFLTLTGLYVGLRQFRQRRSGRHSPYRSWALWHHYGGLIFGIVTLTWVASGLISMNPLGALAGSSSSPERQRLQGPPLAWQDLPGLLQPLEQSQPWPDNSVRLHWQTSGGQTALISHNREGDMQRYGARTLSSAPLDKHDLRQLAGQMLPEKNLVAAQLLTEADHYYYPHHNPVELPVYRVIAEDGTRYYLSPASGALIRKIDSERQWYRWLFHGVHRGDFSAWLRSRPLWDGFMLVLLTGVSLLCATGTYLGIKRLRFTARRRQTQRQRPDRAKARL